MSINFLRQARSNTYYRGTPLNTADYQSGAIMTMKSVADKLNSARGGGYNANPYTILNTNYLNKTFIVQNLMITNESEDTYNSINVSTVINYENVNSTNTSGYARDIVNQRLIGPQQTAQIISKDTSLVLGIQGNNIVYETTYGRYCRLDLQHSGGDMSYYMAYLEIDYQS